MLQIVKPKTHKARRALEKRAPKLHEDAKRSCFLHGSKTSMLLKRVIVDLFHITKSGGNSIKLTKKNDSIRPFEGGMEASLEFIAQKADCSLFAFGSHSKKRPHNLVLGRLYDHHLYDMVELGVDFYKSVSECGGGGKFAPQVGSKPSFAFIGSEFESNEQLKQLRELLLDFFRGEEVTTMDLLGLDRLILCTANAGKLWFQHCAVRQLKSPSPQSQSQSVRVQLVETGPSIAFTVRRSRRPSEDLRKQAIRTAPPERRKKVKNVSTDSMLGKVGRIYMPKQEVDGIALQKMKGLKRERRETAKTRSEEKQANGVNGDTHKKQRKEES